jgi:hypothetical protein
MRRGARRANLGGTGGTGNTGERFLAQKSVKKVARNA